jgi:uncharacterized protein (DUF849 family)
MHLVQDACMDAHVSLRRAGTLVGAIAEQLRSPAPTRVARLDLAAAAAVLRQAGASVAHVHVDARTDVDA